MNTNKVRFYVNTTLFFLKNVWFAPSVNYLYVLFGVILLVLRIGQDLKLHDILLSMFFLGLTAFCIGNVVFDKSRRISPYFLLLPLSTRKLLHLLTLSGFVYSVIVQSVLVVSIYMSSGLPFIGNPHITNVETPSGEVLSMVEGFILDIDGRWEIPYKKVMRPSLIFGIVTSKKGWPIFPYWQILLSLLFTLITFYFIVCYHINADSTHRKSLSHWLIVGTYTIFGVVILIDFMLPSKTIWLWRTYWDQSIWVFPLLVSICIIGLIVRLYFKLSKSTEIEELSK